MPETPPRRDPETFRSGTPVPDEQSIRLVGETRGLAARDDAHAETEGSLLTPVNGGEPPHSPMADDTKKTNSSRLGLTNRPPAALRRADMAARLLALSAGVLILLLAAGIIIRLLDLSRLSISTFGLGFITSTAWNPVGEKYGALPYLYGTLVSAAIALIIATPFGIGTALFLTEIAPRRLRAPVGFVVEMLAAIPSVVYGLWGLLVLSPIMAEHVGPALNHTLGRWIPLFRGACYGTSMLTAGLILAVMVVPYITAISREVLRTVPPDLKAASYALGATSSETIWRVVLPYAKVGIGGGIILGLGRALGETMAVAMVIGNSPKIEASLLRPGHSMAAVIANEFREASTPLYTSSLVYIGLLLFVVTMSINFIAGYVFLRNRHVRR